MQTRESGSVANDISSTKREVHPGDHRDGGPLGKHGHHRVVHAAAHHIGQDVNRIGRIERVDKRDCALVNLVLVIPLQRDHVDTRRIADDHLERVAGTCRKTTMRCKYDLVHMYLLFVTVIIDVIYILV